MTELAIDVDAPPDSGYDQAAGERVVDVGSGAGSTPASLRVRSGLPDRWLVST